MPNRPQTDPLSDSLADFSEAERDVAMSRFQALRPHVQDGATLTETAVMANVPISTIQRWAASYRDGGLAGLAGGELLEQFTKGDDDDEGERAERRSGLQKPRSGFVELAITQTANAFERMLTIPSAQVTKLFPSTLELRS